MATPATRAAALPPLVGRLATRRIARATTRVEARACPVTRISTICMLNLSRLQKPESPCQASRMATGP